MLYKSVRFVLFTKTSFIANVSRIIYLKEISIVCDNIERCTNCQDTHSNDF